MDKKELIALIEKTHQDLFALLEAQPDEKWMEGPEGKWTTGQHILHLVKSIQKLNHAMSFPGMVLKYKYGVCNRALRDYEQVAQRYQEKLTQHQEKAKKFNQHLKIPSLAQKNLLLSTLKIQQKKLQYKTRKWNDSKLDTLVLPHPLMGKMPVRELIMWTAHHTEHHTKSLQAL